MKVTNQEARATRGRPKRVRTLPPGVVEVAANHVDRGLGFWGRVSIRDEIIFLPGQRDRQAALDRAEALAQSLGAIDIRYA